MIPPEVPHEDHGPSRRALDDRPLLRRVSTVVWASFLGAAVSMTVLLLIPDRITLPPTTPRDGALIFVGLWLLAVIPAWFASVLADTSPKDDDDTG